jgi:pilus assembly protein Flp/PilA
MLTIREFLKSDEGMTAIEYGLIGALIIVAIAAGITAVATRLNVAYTQVQNILPTS